MSDDFERKIDLVGLHGLLMISRIPHYFVYIFRFILNFDEVAYFSQGMTHLVRI